MPNHSFAALHWMTGQARHFCPASKSNAIKLLANEEAQLQIFRLRSDVFLGGDFQTLTDALASENKH